MNNRKLAIAFTAAALCAATVFVGVIQYSSADTRGGSSDKHTSSAQVEWGAGSLVRMRSPLPEYSSAPAESAHAFTPSTPEVDPAAFDDPDSYLKYNSENDTYILTEEEKALCDEALFVGDSICYGFSAWGAVNEKNVYATESVSARNFFEHRMFYRGVPAKFIPVLKTVNPKRIFLSMGMNDVNITSAEEFCLNYKEIITAALLNTEAEVYVCAITPISRLQFTKPSYIAEFNDAMSRFIEKSYYGRVHFVSFAEALKDENGLLCERYDGGDGIHLDMQAYYVAIHELNRQVKMTEQ